MQALILRERRTKRRLRRVQQLTAAEGLHYGNPHALLLAAAIERLPLITAARAEIALTVIVYGIDGKHKHIDDFHIQHAVCKRGRVRGKADVPDHALLLQREYIIQHAVFAVGLQILFLIKAVDEAKIDIICLQIFQLPLDGRPDFVQLRRPAVFAGGIIRAEVYLQVHLIAHVPERLAIGGEDRCVTARHIEIVHAVCHRALNRRDDFRLGFCADHRCAHANGADLLPAAR